MSLEWRINMVKFIGLTKRNILVFFKDKQAVVFSLLTSIIVFVLYLLFLKSSFTDAINNSLKELKGLEDLVEKKDVDMYVNMILLVGVLGSALITVPYNCLSTLIQDREKKVDYDILATPIKRWQIILSYYTSAVLSSILLTSIIFAASIGVLNLK